MEHLKDEAQVCAIIERVQRYLEEKGTTEEVCRVYLRRILHTYYKFDYKAHQRQLTPPEGSSKVSLVDLSQRRGRCPWRCTSRSDSWEWSEAERGGTQGGTGTRLDRAEAGAAVSAESPSGILRHPPSLSRTRRRTRVRTRLC